MIFLSWSKDKSRRIAESVKLFMERVFGREDLFWISSMIKHGAPFFTEILRAREECDQAMFFLTRDNLRNPWLLFEFGLFYTEGKGTCDVWVLLFDGIQPNELVNTPFEHVQTTSFCRGDFTDMITEINQSTGQSESTELLTERVGLYWSDFYKSISDIYRGSDEEELSIHDMSDLLQNRLGISGMRTELVAFPAGFETDTLYRFALESARHRLYVLGRKNRKLFDQQNEGLLDALAKRISSGALDFKCLFLNEASDKLIRDMSQDNVIFSESLKFHTIQAVAMLTGAGIDPSATCRKYEAIRQTAIVIIDNFVLYRPITYNEKGKPDHLTNANFYLADMSSPIAQERLTTFLNLWNNSTQLISREENK